MVLDSDFDRAANKGVNSNSESAAKKSAASERGSDATNAVVASRNGVQTSEVPQAVTFDIVEENSGKRRPRPEGRYWAEAELNRRHTDFQVVLVVTPA